MKHLKRLTKYQKIFLSKQGLDPKDFLLERQTFECYVFYSIKNKRLVCLRR
ncbi:DUF6906 family protein [Clostridium sp. DL1XJH146]